MPNRRRPAQADPDEDELARRWSLTPADLAVAAECRGDDHRRRFAVQLCWLRAHGRFLDDYRHAPVKIVNHLSRQLGLPPVLFLDRPGRAQTERAQALRIRRHIGLRPFDSGVAADLRHWLGQGAIEGRTAAELLVRAEDKLRGWHVMLPATSTLERLVTAEVTHATTQGKRMKVCDPMTGALSGKSQVRKPCRTRQRAGSQSRLPADLRHK